MFCFDVLSSASFPDPNTCFVGQCYMLLNVHHHIKNWVKDACSILQDSLSRLKRKSQQAGRDSARVNSANFDPVVLGWTPPTPVMWQCVHFVIRKVLFPTLAKPYQWQDTTSQNKHTAYGMGLWACAASHTWVSVLGVATRLLPALQPRCSKVHSRNPERSGESCWTLR